MKWIVVVSLLLFFACDDESKSDCTVYEEPIIQCVCTYEYNPVCGCNGKTYGNPCQAECLLVPSYEMGECK